MTPEQSRLATRAAIKAGILVREPCEVCGDEPTHAHHEDYDRPYDVVFLCPFHHRTLHGSRYSPPRTVEEMTVTALAWQAICELRKAAA